MPRLPALTRRLLAPALILALGAVAPPALASEASDAWKEAKAMKDGIRKAGDENARAEATKAFEEFCKKKVEVLSASRGSMSKLDLMYLGYVQGWAGDHAGAIATMRSAVDKQEETKYGANIHSALVAAYLDADQPDGAAAEVEKMMSLYEGSKETKIVVMNLGMAYRAALNHEKAAKWLSKAFELGNTNATKPLVNSLLMLGKKDEAVAAAQNAVEHGVPQQREDMEVVKAITEKFGTDVSGMVKFDAFVPAGEPELKDKVLVFAFWNVSARTLQWSLKLLDNVKRTFQEDVTCVAVTTYYKKDAETGQMDANMSPETERGFGQRLQENFSWRGWMGYLPNEEAVKAWGVSALPHVVVVGKDGKLLFAHTMDVSEQTDVKILNKVIKDATGR